MPHIDRLRQLFTENLSLFSALGDPIRQQLLLLMMDGSRRSVEELASETDLARPTISHHLKVLKEAHIIGSHKVGRKIYYSPQLARRCRPVNELIDTIIAIERQR